MTSAESSAKAAISEASGRDGPRRDRRPGLAADRFRRALAGYLLAWPWFDGLSTWILRRLYFPASRLWAAAELADGSAERFWQAVPMRRRLEHSRRLESVLARCDQARTRAQALETEWQRVFFGPEESSPNYRSAVEAARLGGRHAYNAARRFFLFLLDREVPRARLETATPAEVAAVYGKARRDLTPFVAPPDPMPEIEVSRAIPGAAATDYWLRFKSPSARLGDMVYARVHEPQGAADAPTIIFGHGICVEFDHWHGLIDEADTLCKAGFRVIRPEAPWHGRRVPAGYFGGERLIATYPLGLLDAVLGSLQEWAVIADWSRKTSRGALAFGGTSLGAQVAQLAADRAREWPARLRPDGLFLITHCGSMGEAAQHGEIAKIVGGAEEAVRKGWTAEEVDRYAALLDPRPEAAVAPTRIVSVLGRRDIVTPFSSALSLIDGWKVPGDNRFVWDRGHFSIPMTLIRNPAPIARFREVMR
jgi:pimeloyl-ACP methyl ester carboxylesterase